MAHMAQSLAGRVEAEVAALDGLDGAALRARWSELTGMPAPGVSPRLLRLAVAWHIQARAFGGLSSATRRAIVQIGSGKSKTDHARPDTRLVREWQGVAHVVTIGSDGAILWNNRSWSSLSAVARAITGGHWSGPAFFGLRKSKDRPPKPTEPGPGASEVSQRRGGRPERAQSAIEASDKAIASSLRSTAKRAHS
jgi:hypothetical protein